MVPRSIALAVGASLGYLAYLFYARDRNKADSHLQLAYGDSLDARQRKIIIRNMFINFGKNGADVFRFKKFYHKEIKDLVDVEGLEYFDKVYNRGKGLIAVSGHIGNFELMAIHMANIGHKSAAIARELYDKRLNELLVDNRRSLGLAMVDTHDSPRQALRFLKQGYVLGVLIDTDSIRVRSMFIPAFGRLSNTPVGQSMLGLRAGAGFVPIACVRNGKRYKIVIHPEVTIEKSNNFEKDVYNITRKCTEELEKIITEYKDQWIWLHNRWNTRPKEPINDSDGTIK